MSVSVKDIDGLRALITEDWGEWTAPVEVTQEMINTFADVTKDHQWIHVDIEKANAGPFGGPIAHGFLTLSLVSHFSVEMGLDVEGLLGVLNESFRKSALFSLENIENGADSREKTPACKHHVSVSPLLRDLGSHYAPHVCGPKRRKPHKQRLQPLP